MPGSRHTPCAVRVCLLLLARPLLAYTEGLSWNAVMMNFRRRTSWHAWLAGAGAVLGLFQASPSWAQFGFLAVGTRFELSAAVQVDQVDNAVRVQVDRVRSLLAARQWDEAVETLRRLDETQENRLLPIAPSRYIGLHDWCQVQFASLPPEALALYRRRVDPVAREWYERGIAQRDGDLLQRVVDRAFASSYGDKALMAIGAMALESGEYAGARFAWERIIPSSLLKKGTGSELTEATATNNGGREVPIPLFQPSSSAGTWPGYPDTTLDLAAVRARLVLVSILEGARQRAAVELAEFARLHPNAQGRLGGKQGRYVDLLKDLLGESTAWPAPASNPGWSTFAGSFCRNKNRPAADRRGSGRMADFAARLRPRRSSWSSAEFPSFAG